MEPSSVESGFYNSANFITENLYSLLSHLGIPDRWIGILNVIILSVIALVFVVLLQKIAKYIMVFVMRKIYNVTRMNFLQYALRYRLPHYLALIVPYTFVVNMIPTIFAYYPSLISPLLKTADIYMVFMVIWMLMALIKSLMEVLAERPAFQKKPMQSYAQIIQIIFYIIGAVVIFSIITGKSATAFFAAMGAASAVLMLMFKDTIMGFVSSIQLSSNEMVMLGDWITMNKYGADGDVEEINLTTVKVRNFDKTITTIPTYALISDSFQNWRGMQESGGRRIRRSIYVKQSDIRSLTDKELDEFEKVEALKNYITGKREAYGGLNEKLNMGGNSILHGYEITNCDLFIQYAIWYFRNHPEIHQNLTLLVRQLEPTVHGLPIQIYVFTNTTAWTEYERIAGEVMSHMIANVKTFGLTIYESVTGTDTHDINIYPQGKVGGDLL